MMPAPISPASTLAWACFDEFVSCFRSDNERRELFAEVAWSALHGMAVVSDSGRIPPGRPGGTARFPRHSDRRHASGLTTRQDGGMAVAPLQGQVVDAEDPRHAQRGSGSRVRIRSAVEREVATTRCREGPAPARSR